jgi:hypothetical protein
MNVAETYRGQYDAYFTPTLETEASLNANIGYGVFLNFTQATLLTD